LSKHGRAAEEKTMIKERTRKRLAFLNPVHFGPDNPPQHISLITEFSDRGAHVKTNRVYGPGTRLYLVIDTPDRRYEAQGVVVWAKKVPQMVAPYVKHGMGIKFTHVKQDLVDLYKEKLKAVFTIEPIL
jgi:Tfp pilus assembly protein PilZ